MQKPLFVPDGNTNVHTNPFPLCRFLCVESRPVRVSGHIAQMERQLLSLLPGASPPYFGSLILAPSVVPRCAAKSQAAARPAGRHAAELTEEAEGCRLYFKRHFSHSAERLSCDSCCMLRFYVPLRV